MNDHNDSFLNNQLKKLRSNVKWEKEGQEKVRNNIISTINQQHNIKQSKIKKRKLSLAVIFPAILLVILGVGLSLFLPSNQISDNHMTKSAENQEVKSAFVDFQYDISEEVKKDITNINDSGFELKLPALSITEDMEIELVETIKREGSEARRVDVKSFFTFEGNKEFFLMQEYTGNSNDRQLVEKGATAIQEKAVEILDINGDKAYIVNNKRSKTLYLLTDEYGFSLHSNDLSTEQMSRLMESIDLN